MVREVESLNRLLSESGSTDWIAQAEKEMKNARKKLAEKILNNRDIRVLMIAGPSSSGKTTYAGLLAQELFAHGIRARQIGIDDYYLDRQDVPLDEDGKHDFECPEAIDVELFNRDMLSLLAGKTVRIPTLNFVTGHREYSGKTLRLAENELLIIEGIHGLVDSLSYFLPGQHKFKIFLCPMLQVKVGNQMLEPADLRLMRRIVRDVRMRGTSAGRTINMWSSVRRGEEKYIFPFINNVDVQVDTSLEYEVYAMKPYVLSCLETIRPEDEAYPVRERLCGLLSHFEGSILREQIPENSVLKEFIG